MAEDSDLERTESATAHRVEQAREKGQVPRSRELATFLVLLVAGMVLYGLAPWWQAKMASLLQIGLTWDAKMVKEPEAMLIQLRDLTLLALIVTLPIIGAITLVALISPVLLGGWNVSSEALFPQWDRLDPLAGMKRIFSLSSLNELVKAILKTILLFGLGWWMIQKELPELFSLMNQAPAPAVRHAGELIALVFAVMVSGLALIAAIDVPLQLWTYYRNLRMTKEEVRQEFKEMEGDPHLKARIRQIQREQAKKRMMSEVPKASVVLTNPTMYAVALRYDAANMKAPKVVAKGMHWVADNIRTLAEEHRVPIVQAAPLARSLYRHAELDREIPAALFTAVAEVLAYVYQLEDWAKYGNWFNVPKPQLPENLAIPTDLVVAEEEAVA